MCAFSCRHVSEGGFRKFFINENNVGKGLILTTLNFIEHGIVLIKFIEEKRMRKQRNAKEIIDGCFCDCFGMGFFFYLIVTLFLWSFSDTMTAYSLNCKLDFGNSNNKSRIITILSKKKKYFH